jgi:hydrogenase expression/formation protein HypE
VRKLSEKIKLSHGAGGVETHELIRKVLLPDISLKKVYDGIGLDEMDDSATIPLKSLSLSSKVVVTTDSYTVSPIFFPGGNIGSLAATGTINDLAVMGARPIAVLDSIVVEEGFSVEQLRQIVNSFIEIVNLEGVALIGGDLKVMPKGTLDKIVITSVGIGLAKGEVIKDSEVKVGDKIIVSGGIGEHGAAILLAQLGLDAESEEIVSDVQTVTKIMESAMSVGGVHAAKDPTRGGIAMALNEFASKSKVVIVIEEERIPIKQAVRNYSEMLGIDPLALACEGRVLMSVDSMLADDILASIKRLGFKDASIIGEVSEKREDGCVVLRTISGGIRMLEPPIGELVPRIC